MSVADHADARALLGGARRVRTRVRGFAPWAPRGTTLELLEQVRGVLDEYEDYLPLTIRQIFYRLVGAHNYEKTERAYGRLCEHLNRARRARIIPMAASAPRPSAGTARSSSCALFARWRPTSHLTTAQGRRHDLLWIAKPPAW